jgi:hypothetical protein
MKCRPRVIAPVGELRNLAPQMPFRLAAMRTHPLPRKLANSPVHHIPPKPETALKWTDPKARQVQGGNTAVKRRQSNTIPT